MEEQESRAPQPNDEDRIKYYVALDLGSESMAAYYEEKATGRGGMIHMQAHAKTLLDKEPIYLREEDGTVSPRLRTRIFLIDFRQPDELPPDHARLDFVEGSLPKMKEYTEPTIDPSNQSKNMGKVYERESLFDYFYTADQEFKAPIMPNPKIPFQEGGDAIIPKVTAKNGGKVSYSPEVLLQHLTTQVVRNFLLKSPELSHAAPSEIFLLLTVPNVYSLTHIESIRQFVKCHTGIASVGAIYESDAVAYFILRNPLQGDPDYVRRFHDRIINRPNQKELRLVTADIGRGTTDLSLVQLTEPPNRKTPKKSKGEKKGTSTQTDNQGRHFVFARIGKSDGGNRLSYILAEYYNERLKENYEHIEATFQTAPVFDFLTAPKVNEGYSIGGRQGAVIGPLETLINEVKKNITKDYELKLARRAQVELIDAIIDRLFRTMDSKLGADEWKNNDGYLKVGEAIRQSFILPRKLPKRSYVDFLKLGILRPKYAQTQKHLCDLRHRINKYVEDNAVALVSQLNIMAAERERIGKKKRRGRRSSLVAARGLGIDNSFHRNHTYVLVAGQASQFQPMHVAIERIFRKFHIPPKNVLFLRGALAKEACCKGAIGFLSAMLKESNPEELHGSYGFLRVAATGKTNLFKAVDMAKIKHGQADEISFTAKAEYWYVYSPLPSLDENAPPELNNGYTALISKEVGARFKVEYDPQTLKMTINDKPIKKLGNFGDVYESIFPKVWPEAVKRRDREGE